MPIDYKRYPVNWKSEIRPEILIRAKHRCEFCKVKDGSRVFRIKIDKNPVIWSRTKKEVISSGMPDHNIKISLERPIKIVLTIAHLDHDESNHSVELDRLAALCQLCHLRYDVEEKYKRAINKETMSV